MSQTRSDSRGEFSGGRWLFVAVFVCGACGGPDDPEADDPFASMTWTIAADPALRLGAIDDPSLAFGSVITLDIGPDGNVYTRHAGEAAIRRWTYDGEPAGSIGRAGEGPGEFQRISASGFFGSDTLWAMDASGYRVSYFGLDGTFLASVRPTVDIGSREDGFNVPPRPSRPLRDGTFLGEAPAFSQSIAEGELTSSPVAHMTVGGEVLSEVWRRDWRTSDVLALLRDGGGSFGPQPFADQTLYTWTGHGLLVLDRRAYSGSGEAHVQLTWIALSGDTVLRQSIPYDVKPLPVAAVDSSSRVVAASMHRFLSQRDPGLSLGALEVQIREAIYAPDYLPPVARMVTAADGSIWLQKFELGGGDRSWLVMDAQGVPRGTAVVPAAVRVLTIHDGDLWGVETDALDVNYIVRYRLVPPGGP